MSNTVPMLQEAEPHVDDAAQAIALHRPPAMPAATVAKITSAICRVMAKVGVVEKQGTNEFFRYSYVQMQDVLQKLTPLMADAGLAILQTEVKRELDDGGKALAITYAFTICHSSGEIWPERLLWTGSSIARNRNNTWDDKAINKCATAARKYCLLSLFQVPTADSDDPDRGENDGGDRRVARTDAEQDSSQLTYDALRAELGALEESGISLEACTNWARDNRERFHQLNDEHRIAMVNFHNAAKERVKAKWQKAKAEEGLGNDAIADLLEKK